MIYDAAGLGPKMKSFLVGHEQPTIICGSLGGLSMIAIAFSIFFQPVKVYHLRSGRGDTLLIELLDEETWNILESVLESC